VVAALAIVVLDRRRLAEAAGREAMRWELWLIAVAAAIAGLLAVSVILVLIIAGLAYAVV
jgi:hypothetical protein